MTTYTINTIQAEMTASGSHWWDKGTMQFFGCRVGSKVYQGNGGIYFVTSESFDGSRGYSVRQYNPPGKYRRYHCIGCGHAWSSPVTMSDNTPNISGEKTEFCPKCNVRDTVGQPAELHSGDINTTGDAGSLTRNQAHREAARLAGPESVIVQDAHKPATAAEQLAMDIQRGGGRARVSTAGRLIQLAKKHHKLMEDYCNYGGVYDDDGEPLPKLAALLESLERSAKDHLCGIVTQGDPRGATVKLRLPNGNTNDWGKDGWCVPTR